MKDDETFGLIKTLVDAHTMGVHAAAALLRECGFRVVISPPEIGDAVDRIFNESAQRRLIQWIEENRITRLGFSYRLDPDTGINIFGRIIYALKSKGYYESAHAQIRSAFFAGLASACDVIDREYMGRIATFRGGESPKETLLMIGIPMEKIPNKVKEGCQYDNDLITFGECIVKSGEYLRLKAPERILYPEYGTKRDRLELRIENNYYSNAFQPIIRAHSGPYSADMPRGICLKEYLAWCRDLAKAGHLDVLSIGSSQLSQSNFGESWKDMPNGGGVPVNSEEEYADIWEAARPMLVRTYSGTKNLIRLAGIYERSLNISWHALSLWWFNELDGRGTNSLYDNLKEHLAAIRYISATNKPVETNVPHHFAFRGADDVTYIVSGFLAAKAAKRHGTRTFILQNMLNTPRSVWGIQDLAKGRTLLKLVKELEDGNFRVVFQPRAGLDYLRPDLEAAKAQLAAVTAMMDDIDPFNRRSPEIIHVVSYSEALFLATPDIINESIKITKTALNVYRRLKKQGLTADVMTDDIRNRQADMEAASREIIRTMEECIPDLYSPEGLYLAFVGGWLPTPELWSDSDEFTYAKGWGSKIANGGVVLCDHDAVVTTDGRINRCVSNMDGANYILKHKYRRG